MAAPLQVHTTCRCLVLASHTLHPSAPAAESITHLGSASASYRGAAPSLLGQSKFHCTQSIFENGRYQLTGFGCLLHFFCSWTDRNLHHNVSCRVVSCVMGSGAGASWRLPCKCTPPAGAWSSRHTLSIRVPQRQSQSRTLVPPPPPTVEQRQACSVSQSFTAPSQFLRMAVINSPVSDAFYIFSARGPIEICITMCRVVSCRVSWGLVPAPAHTFFF